MEGNEIYPIPDLFIFNRVVSITNHRNKHLKGGRGGMYPTNRLGSATTKKISDLRSYYCFYVLFFFFLCNNTPCARSPSDRYLRSKFKYIDKERIGIWGKGYGGYATGMILAKQPEIFRCGIATSPITNWAHFGKCLASLFERLCKRKKKENPLIYLTR